VIQVRGIIMSVIFHPSFIVLKQINGNGPIYKVEVCAKTLQVLNKEVLNGIPD
jgi:hypothetical protein